MLTRYLEKLFAGNDLDAAEMEEAFRIMTGCEVAHSQIGAFLAALRMKGVTAPELAGAARMLRRDAAFIDCGGRETVDIVGTGGDGRSSFNISTASAIVAAGAGVCVAKHGNRAASGKCGAADVLAKLGYNLDASPAVIENAIAVNGLGFLFAAKLHPAMAAMAVLRRELKIGTVFNLLGPLCNPAGSRAMVLGVYAPELTELFAAVLVELGVRRALVVHGLDGLDEISSAAATRVSEVNGSEITTYELLPEVILGESFEPSDLTGGEPDLNAQILRDVLAGRAKPGARAAVLLNAGAAIYVAGLAPDLNAGVAAAARSIDSGAAARKLDELVEASHGKCD
ncbi:MAG: anthranilate phosphoribosyltransferase [Victivallaceae bacterium]|nr:anthranilate phosphoribosyltransferase [Victivallaceae bacterium]